jgi:hypothetical protein
MRRLLVAMSLTMVASLALSGVAFATHSDTNAAGPPKDFAVGSGMVADDAFVDFLDVSLGAYSGPTGENPQGFINYRDASDFAGQDVPNSKGNVVCLAVKDNRAVAVAEFKEEPPFPGNPYAVLLVEDNGGPNSTIPDRVSALSAWVDLEQMPLEDTCNLYIQVMDAFPLEPIDSGNLTVHDATP